MSLLNYPDLFMFLFEHVAETKSEKLDKDELLKLREESPEKFETIRKQYIYRHEFDY